MRKIGFWVLCGLLGFWLIEKIFPDSDDNGEPVEEIQKVSNQSYINKYFKLP